MHPLCIDEKRYATRKGHGYYREYERRLSPLRSGPVALLELGIAEGGSLELWRDWFPEGTIAGLDLNPPPISDPTGRIRLYRGHQADSALLTRIAEECAPKGFDIIIDDASHLAKDARASYAHLFTHHLKPGGIYVIEDWGTGYWPSWPDGAAYSGPGHTAGMAGFIKELVDEVASVDRSYQGDATRGALASTIASLELMHGMAFVRKAGPGA